MVIENKNINLGKLSLTGHSLALNTYMDGMHGVLIQKSLKCYLPLTVFPNKWLKIASLTRSPLDLREDYTLSNLMDWCYRITNAFIRYEKICHLMTFRVATTELDNAYNLKRK